MSRKEIIFLTGKQILLIMVLVGNALVIGFMVRYHSVKIFRQQKSDLAIFTEAQRKERDIKEEIRILENKETWNETEYAKKFESNILDNLEIKIK